MTVKSWYKWQRNIHKTHTIECKNRTIRIYSDDNILGCLFNGDESVELLIERDGVCLHGFNTHHYKKKEGYIINRKDIVKVIY